ncbi:hypothetical protein GQ457_05G029230 [Hibiscus cannabinus]
MQQPQDRRLKPLTATGEKNKQQQPPQKCPRCDSINTKFCYYNNYSLSQPRYFCKSCRRYWTQGGTIRNVPVGGGCRKGKRSKVSSSSENPRSPPPQIPPRQQQQQQQTLFPGGGFLSSLAAIQSMNQQQPFNQSISFGSSNLCLLQGYSVPSSFGTQVQQHQPSQQPQFLQMGDGDENGLNMYPLDHPEGNSWHQSFINNSNPTISEAALWSINNISTDKNTSGSLNPSSQLSDSESDLPGYGPP